MNTRFLYTTATLFITNLAKENIQMHLEKCPNLSYFCVPAVPPILAGILFENASLVVAFLTGSFAISIPAKKSFHFHFKNISE